MTLSFVRRWTERFGLVGAAAIAAMACPEAATDITEVPSDPSFNFSVTSSFEEPQGTFSVDGLTLAAFDTTISDAFARAVPGPAGRAFSGGAWVFAAVGNASTDTRSPVLVDDDGGISGVLAVLDPSFFGAGFHNPFISGGTFVGLDPNTTYTIALVRYALAPNGELDAAARALGEVPADVDDLVLDAGTPKGDPTVNIEVFPTIIFAQEDANPFVLGQITTDGSGAANMDVVIQTVTSTGTSVLYEDQSGSPPAAAFDSSLVARNDDVATTLPRYNYLVVYRGSAATADDVLALPSALRLQMGQDFLQDGSPVNNGYAPFPTPLTVGALVAAPGGAGRPDSISATFNEMEALAGGAVYEAWLVNPNTGSMVPAQGTYNRVKIIAERDPATGEIIGTRDSVVETTPSTASFVGGDQEDGFRHQLIIADAGLGGGASDSVGFHTHLVLTIADAPGGNAPAAARPFWFGFTDQNGTPDNFFDDAFTFNGTTEFGTFDPDAPSASLPYGGDGGGIGGFREDILSVDLEALSRPPVGYSYVGWLVREDGSAFRLPDITGPPPQRVSLVDADVEDVQGITTRTGILDANLRVDADQAEIDFGTFTTFVLSLEPKLGLGDLGPVRSHVGTVPERIAN